MNFSYPLTRSGMPSYTPLVFLFFAAGACTSDETSTEMDNTAPDLSQASDDLAQSLEDFHTLNTENGGNYCTVTWESDWFFHDEWSATEYVSNTPARFHECYRDWSDEVSAWSSWFCTLEDAPLASIADWTSMPVLYEQCQAVIENSEETGYPLTISFDEEGILSTCFNQETGCVDGCEWGIPLYRFYFGSCESTEWETPVL